MVFTTGWRVEERESWCYLDAQKGFVALGTSCSCHVTKLPSCKSATPASNRFCMYLPLIMNYPCHPHTLTDTNKVIGLVTGVGRLVENPTVPRRSFAFCCVLTATILMRTPSIRSQLEVHSWKQKIHYFTRLVKWYLCLSTTTWSRRWSMSVKCLATDRKKTFRIYGTGINSRLVLLAFQLLPIILCCPAKELEYIKIRYKRFLSHKV